MSAGSSSPWSGDLSGSPFWRGAAALFPFNFSPSPISSSSIKRAAGSGGGGRCGPGCFLASSPLYLDGVSGPPDLCRGARPKGVDCVSRLKHMCSLFRYLCTCSVCHSIATRSYTCSWGISYSLCISKSLWAANLVVLKSGISVSAHVTWSQLCLSRY